ncbi:histidine kinase [Parashewanella curva]|uniref:Histidine kinase n=1 Tax=Parashewanella curva TaxID=2338552 RepID=A0A3L8PYZ6_9GAMM|nr:histidine kinase [Parashewanella curva]RLV59738.1 histidine kinase [Parashewanella curva]
MEPSFQFPKSMKDFSRNPLGIIALFIVLVYGFACIIFGYSSPALQPDERTPIIWFIVLFPLCILFLFGWLVSRHHDKLYAPQDYRTDDSFLKTLTQRAAKDSAVYIDDLLQYGGDLEIIKDQETKIKNDLHKRNLSYDNDTSNVLIRQLAASQVLSWFERIYNAIFGSQIKLLTAAKDGVELKVVEAAFQTVKENNLEQLGTWNLEQYLLYLTSTGLLHKENETFKTTKYGNDFLLILESSGFTKDRQF